MKNTLETKLKEIGNDKICPAAVMIRDGKILRGMRNYTKEKWKDMSVWTTPGGRCDNGETLEQTLRREVTEEVGILNFTIVDFIGEVRGAKEGDILPIFYCTTKEDAKLMEPEKFSEWKWFSMDEYIADKSEFNSEAKKLIRSYLLKNNIQ